MRIQHNIMAMNAYRNYTNNVNAMKKNLEKLSSGYKINRAGDDAAGLAISEKMRAQITGLQTAQKNAKDGISLVQTAEGASTEVHDMLNRMVELATQSANGTYDNTTDRNQMQKEINQLREEINRIADSANFNGIQLLDGSMSTAASKVGSVSLVSAGEAPEVEIIDATDSPLTWATAGQATTNATISSIPSTSKMHLHSESTPGALGNFTIDLGGMKVEVASTAGATVSINVKFGGATFTYAASTGETVTASKIATEMAKYVLTATKGGTLSFVKATANVAAGDMVFKIAKNADNNSVTFTAAAIAKKATTGNTFLADTIASSNGTKLTTTNNLPTGWDLKHNYTVTASVSAAANVARQQGFQQVGVTQYTNTKSDGGNQFGQTVIALDPTKIKDGMLIKVGTGSTAKTYTIRTKGTVANSEASTTIDLTKIINASVATNGHKADIAQAIANKFKQDNLGGIEIGVDNSNNLVIAEKVNADRTSAADSAVKKAMSSYSTFVDLVKFQEKKESNEVKGQAKLEINTGKLHNGNTLTITNNTGTTKSYTVTTDKANAGKEGYVYVAASKMGTDLASAVKTAIGDVTASTAFGSGATIAVSGKTVTINFNVKGGSEASDIKARATMTGNKPLTLQIGDTADKFNQLDVDIADCHTESLGIADISVADQDKAAIAVNKIKDAINYVSNVRGTLGATQNRLDHTINNLSVMTENIQDAESTIRDVDVAEEMMAYTKNNILIQSAQAMLAQANQVPQGVLQLLG